MKNLAEVVGPQAAAPRKHFMVQDVCINDWLLMSFFVLKLEAQSDEKKIVN